MTTPKVKCQLALVHELTMSTDSVPVLDDITGVCIEPIVKQAVNFLRCGCPGVQLTIDSQSSNYKRSINVLAGWLECLTLSGERFEMKRGVKTKDGIEILLVTRHTD